MSEKSSSGTKTPIKQKLRPVGSGTVVLHLLMHAYSMLSYIAKIYHSGSSSLFFSFLFFTFAQSDLKWVNDEKRL